MRFTAGVFLLALLAPAGCASAPPSVAKDSAPVTHDREPLKWAPFSAETFARAKAERKFVILDGSAEWCHWCHVMEATTYRDETVRVLLAKSFVAVKVDVDARPDLAERYGDYGWPGEASRTTSSIARSRRRSCSSRTTQRWRWRSSGSRMRRRMRSMRRPLR